MRVFNFPTPVCECRDYLVIHVEDGLPYIRVECVREDCPQVGIIKRIKLPELQYDVVDELRPEVAHESEA